MIWKYKDLALERLHANGMKPLDPSEAGKLERSCLNAVAQECRQLVAPYLKGIPQNMSSSPSLIYIYMYDLSEQDEYRANYGLCITEMRGRYHIAYIGISTIVLLGDYDYAALTFLHELAHLEVDGHGDDFTARLDFLIAEFNKATGRHIEYPKHYLELLRLHADSADPLRDGLTGSGWVRRINTYYQEEIT